MNAASPRTRLVRLLAVCATVALLSAPATAHAAGLAASAHRAAGRLPATALRRGGVGALVYTPGIQEGDLRAGGTFVDYITSSEVGNNIDIFDVPFYAGQEATVTVRAAAGSQVKLLQVELWSNTSLDAGTPLTYYRGDVTSPRTLHYHLTDSDWHYIVVYGVVGSGRYTLSYQFSDPAPVSDVARIAGANRWATAVATSKASFPGTATAVVIATGADYADALAGSGLCGSYDAPMLLVKQNELPSYVRDEVNRLKPSKVFVLGSAVSVSDGVLAALQDPSREVTRVAGRLRYDTAAAIAKQVHDHEEATGRGFAGQAFVVNGLKFPDALTASPFAFHNRWPVLLVQSNAIPPATRNAITSLGVTKLYLIGGPTTISDGVKIALPLPALQKERLWGGAGTGRLETSVKVATWAMDHGWGKWGTIGITTGWNYPDALGGGVWAGKNGGALLLTNWLYMENVTFDAIGSHVETMGGTVDAIHTARLFGSGSSVSGYVFGDADAALQY